MSSSLMGLPLLPHDCRVNVLVLYGSIGVYFTLQRNIERNKVQSAVQKTNTNEPLYLTEK